MSRWDEMLKEMVEWAFVDSIKDDEIVIEKYLLFFTLWSLYDKGSF